MLPDLIAVPELLRPYAFVLIAIVVGLLVGNVVARLVAYFVRSIGKRRESVLLKSVHKNLRRPWLAFGTLLCILIALLVVDASRTAEHAVYMFSEQFVTILLYGTGAWLVVQIVEVVGDVLLARYTYEGVQNNYRQRKMYTQLLYLKRVAAILATILALAFVLMQFDSVRQLGAGLLTSAGVGALIIGVAAQKSLANLLAGFQIAFTQPLRIDDAVIFAGEFGRVEEITLTYVVLRVWDDRRLIVPLGKFIDESFQNWTRQSTAITGVVLLYLDYGADLAVVRQQLDAILEGNPLWDERVKSVAVTDCSEQTMTVRLLVSAANSGDAFDLRCQVREGVLAHLRKTQPTALPLRRMQLNTDSSNANGVAEAGNTPQTVQPHSSSPSA